MNLNAMIKPIDKQGRITIPNTFTKDFIKTNPIKVIIKGNHIIFTQTPKKKDKIINFFMPYVNGQIQHRIIQYFEDNPKHIAMYKKNNRVVLIGL